MNIKISDNTSIGSGSYICASVYSPTSGVTDAATNRIRVDEFEYANVNYSCAHYKRQDMHNFFICNT